VKNADVTMKKPSVFKRISCSN